MTDIHSCSYHCDRPLCVLAQRDELRDEISELRLAYTESTRQKNELLVHRKKDAAELAEYTAAADKLAAENKRLRDAMDKWSEHEMLLGAAPPAQLEAWRDRAIAAEAEVARQRVAFESQEPVAWLKQNDFNEDISITETNLRTKQPQYVRDHWKEATPLYRAAPPAQPAEPGQGCACRWDTDDKRIATCVRHQGWLDVVVEWADRAREAEAKVAAQPAPEPCCGEYASCGKTCVPRGKWLGRREAENEWAEPAEPQGWRCQIAEADFEQNTVTLLMACDDYQVSAGPHVLVPLLPLPPRTAP